MTRLLVAVVMTLGFSAVEAAGPASGLPIRLPVNPGTPILTLEFSEAPSHSGAQSGLDVAIDADGKVTVSVPGSRSRQITGRIPEKELRRLLRELLVEHRLMDCDSTHLEEAIRSARRARRRPEPGPDAATTVIRLRSADSSHEVRCRALGLTASQLPELTQVRDLLACQRRLENVAAVIRAGGYDHVNAVLSDANRQLKQQAPEVAALTHRDLHLVDLRPDGTRYLQFSRVPDVDGLRPVGGLVMVSVYQAPGRAPEITITADPS